jgi:hypothetical protein
MMLLSIGRISEDGSGDKVDRAGLSAAADVGYSGGGTNTHKKGGRGMIGHCDTQVILRLRTH